MHADDGPLDAGTTLRIGGQGQSHAVRHDVEGIRRRELGDEGHAERLWKVFARGERENGADTRAGLKFSSARTACRMWCGVMVPVTPPLAASPARCSTSAVTYVLWRTLRHLGRVALNVLAHARRGEGGHCRGWRRLGVSLCGGGRGSGRRGSGRRGCRGCGARLHERRLPLDGERRRRRRGREMDEGGVAGGAQREESVRGETHVSEQRVGGQRRVAVAGRRESLVSMVHPMSYYVWGGVGSLPRAPSQHPAASPASLDSGLRLSCARLSGRVRGPAAREILSMCVCGA